MHNLRWCFSTLGCPELSLDQVCALAAEFNVQALEIRALSGRVDLHTCAAEFGWSAQTTAELLARYRCKIAVAGSSFKLVGNTPEMRREFLDYCQWADSWHFPYVRVFGGGTWGQVLTSADIGQAAETVVWWRNEQQSRGWKVEMLLETHDAFSASEPCEKLLARLEKAVGVIWDSHHTWRLGEEPPAETWSRLSPWIRHVHLKDSIDKPSARHPYTYVLPGDGQAPLAEIVGLLREHNFAGAVSIEWEKLWHPYLPPLRSALERMKSLSWFSKVQIAT